MSDMQKTPLYDTHVKYHGKLVEFAGYLLPVQYTGIVEEHVAVRTKAGLFDVSHMGEIICRGPEALANLQQILTNDFTGMADGQARYSPMCNEEGGTVDDLIVYKIRDDAYFIVVNAANKDKDYRWMADHQFGDAEFVDISADVAQIALQGPRSEEMIRKLTADEDVPKKYYSCVFHAKVAGMDCILSKTGYTGEDGYEIYVSPADAPAMWEALMEAGQEYGILPCGLGARDTLRLEAAMPLYGHEMNDEISPLEAGLSFAVKMGKEDFIGKAAMTERGEPRQKRVGLKVTGRGIVREHEPVYAGGVQIGVTTSGTHAPYLKYPIAMAYVDLAYAEPGTAVTAQVRGREIPLEVVKLPFYKKGQ